MDKENRLDSSVSVLMLSYNYGRFVSRAVQSVLDQTYRNFELIVVDDGSRDDSWERLLGYQSACPDRIHVFSHSGHAHLGIVESLQLAFSKSKGGLIAFLDADDYWQESNLTEKVAVLGRHPEVGIVYSGYRPFGDLPGSIYWRFYEALARRGVPARVPFDLLPSLLRRNPAATFSNFMTRRDLLRTVPLPGKTEKNYDWWILGHISLAGLAYFIPEKPVFWRIHRASACYGPVTRISLGRLFFFLKRYYESLSLTFFGAEDQKRGNGKNARRLKRAISFLESVRNRRRYALGKELVLRPFEAVKFLGYIFLRNLFFGKRAEFTGLKPVCAEA
ncbi:MAG TPA: glycosyltransferase [Candidatus Omnitrophota bacterium]|nr:glycosyltransferase [Candidatus Omnitrophota bacterium]